MSMSTKRKRTVKTLALGAGLALVLAGCSTTAGDEEASTVTESGTESAAVDGATTPPDELASLLASHGLDGMDSAQIIDTLEQQELADRPGDLIASVRPNELLLTGGDVTEAPLPMPEDRFYLSVAPYIEQTHECYFHSLTTCTGELQNADVHVTVTDATSGEVVLDEDLTTEANGFVGIWLPRGIEANLTVTYEDASATTAISTVTDSDATCLTTMQLPA